MPIPEGRNIGVPLVDEFDSFPELLMIPEPKVVEVLPFAVT